MSSIDEESPSVVSSTPMDKSSDKKTSDEPSASSYMRRNSVSNAKFEVDKFDGTINFGMWQCEVLDILNQQDLECTLEDQQVEQVELEVPVVPVPTTSPPQEHHSDVSDSSSESDDVSVPEAVALTQSIATSRPRREIRKPARYDGMVAYALPVITGHSDTDVVELDYPLYGDGRGGHLGVRVLGCCDGLVCIETKSTLFLWNPSTRKSKRLPSVDLPHGHVVVYGFGYDSSIDDYKVVGFLYGHSGIDFEVKVYTLRTDSWRRIGDFPHGDLPYRHSSGVFVNGALHWNVSRETNGIIVSLDLAKETYGKILKPEYRDGRLYETLCAFNGCLCVLSDYRICAHLWVMKEYGIRDSWTKLAVVPYATRVSNLQYIDTMPFFIFKNGEVLLYTRMHLVRYNLKDGTFTYPMSPIDLASSILHPYIESLVSVDMDANKGVPCAPMVQY
ncbi:hypothetical protein RHGRI_014900 [Rhododendron griersonianum]|uniref:F-box associated beta-propeller type 1 domain-containing protein n=1 Tax=Rhododendron griersonianum TaxID=479676 RepID=A0AAV6KBA6_9ERIC|nr:hypothetical protein RHGRI_014900 [Rhododendron griersonianum]